MPGHGGLRRCPGRLTRPFVRRPIGRDRQRRAAHGRRRVLIHGPSTWISSITMSAPSTRLRSRSTRSRPGWPSSPTFGRRFRRPRRTSSWSSSQAWWDCSTPTPACGSQGRSTPTTSCSTRSATAGTRSAPRPVARRHAPRVHRWRAGCRRGRALPAARALGQRERRDGFDAGTAVLRRIPSRHGDRDRSGKALVRPGATRWLDGDGRPALRPGEPMGRANSASLAT